MFRRVFNITSYLWVYLSVLPYIRRQPYRRIALRRRYHAHLRRVSKRHSEISLLCLSSELYELYKKHKFAENPKGRYVVICDAGGVVETNLEPNYYTRREAVAKNLVSLCSDNKDFPAFLHCSMVVKFMASTILCGWLEGGIAVFQFSKNKHDFFGERSTFEIPVNQLVSVEGRDMFTREYMARIGRS